MSRRERILKRLEEVGEGAGAKRSLGQNFLISDHVVDRILQAARTAPFPALVEVGPGLGSLTDDLIGLGQPLTLIELDRRFAQIWRDQGLRVIEGDALRVDWQELQLPPNTLLVSNLPYQISSSLVVERSLAPAGISRMVLMFQKEVAQRIAARAATKEYGLLTVIAQVFWKTESVCEAGPRDFFPPPNVASRVLMFTRRPERKWPRGTKGFLTFAKLAFSHRRKLLARNLGAAFDRTQIDTALAGLDLKPTARAEELDPEALVRLYLALESARV